MYIRWQRTASSSGELHGLAELTRARAGAGGAVVMGSNLTGFGFFSSTFENFLSFLAG